MILLEKLTPEKIISEAKKEYQSMAQEISKLNSMNIHRTLEMGDKKSTQIVVAYPPLNKLEPINEKNIYEGNHFGKNTLYIHIPFCTGICTYCGYARTAISKNDSRILEYLNLLDKESGLLIDSIGGKKIKVESIYIGGGTPTLLDEKELEKLFQIIERDYEFASNVEYTLEGSPETITPEKINKAKSFGVNRASIGAESFNNNALKLMKRRHTAQGTKKAIKTILDCGISEVDCDLIRGLPNYTYEMIIEDAKNIQELDLPSVTCYPYTIKPFSVDSLKINEIDKSEERQLLMHLVFLKSMEKIGRIQRPVDWFIKDETHIIKHEMLKWHDMANQFVLGHGVRGYLVNGVQFAHYREYKDYKKALDKGKLPVEKASYLNNDEIARRKFLFGLKSEINRKEFSKNYGFDPLESRFKETIKNIHAAGGIEITPKEIKLTKTGVLFADAIQEAFIQ